ncbi:MAG TPA: tetratricopeptide repeat protein [Candidatus Omnitrophica bacterium]|nr:tetratricopeptide repeat protein [Candidatus Omnitrophota bacterium]
MINLKFPAMEHHFYLPSVGIYMGIGLLLDKLSLLFPSMIWGGFLILCCIIGKITFLRSCVFQDEESVLESAVKVNPRAVYSIYRLGVTYEKKREYKKALDVLNSIFTAGAPRKIVVQSLVQIADIYRVLKNYSQAENLTLCALKLSPDYSPGFHQLGLIFLDKSKSAQAKIYFDKELKNAADKKGCLIRIAKAFYRHGNYELAIAYCRLLKQLDPSDYRVYLQLAEILESKGRIQEALHYYQRAVDLHPLSYSLHFKLGTLYALKRDKRAEKEFKFALQLNPRASEVYYNLGLFYLLQSKDLNPARKYLKKAQKMGYKLPEAIIKFLNYD